MTPPNTANFTPAEAAARRAESKREIIAILADVPQPYALGIYRQIRDTHTKIPAQHLSWTMRSIIGSRKYLKAASKAEYRTGLDGKQSPLLEKHRRYAQDMLKRRSKPSEVETPMIAGPAKPAITQREPAQPASAIQPKRRRILSLKRKSA